LSTKRRNLLLSLEPLVEKETLTVTVEPNPAKTYGNLRVLFKGENTISISVFDLRGVLIYEDVYDKQRSSIYPIKTDLLSTGIYIIRVVAGLETISQRIVIEK
jgi:hypothetical protein